MSEDILDSNINEPRKEKLIKWKLAIFLGLLAAIFELFLSYQYLAMSSSSNYWQGYWYWWLGYTASGYIIPIGIAMFWEAAWGTPNIRFVKIFLTGLAPYIIGHIIISIVYFLAGYIVANFFFDRFFIWGPSILGVASIFILACLLYFITGKLSYFRKRIKHEQ